MKYSEEKQGAGPAGGLRLSSDKQAGILTYFRAKIKEKEKKTAFSGQRTAFRKKTEGGRQKLFLAGIVVFGSIGIFGIFLKIL